jgi:hypothetical protein
VSDPVEGECVPLHPELQLAKVRARLPMAGSVGERNDPDVSGLTAAFHPGKPIAPGVNVDLIHVVLPFEREWA